MKALSVRQPWAWAIVHAGKRCENRDWRHAPSYRGPLLIHASKGCTLQEYIDATNFMSNIVESMGAAWTWPTVVPSPRRIDRGGIVGRASLVDVRETTAGGHRFTFLDARPTCALCGGDPRGVCPKPDPWAIPETFGLILGDVEPLPFVACKGMLGLFDVTGPWDKGAA